MSWLLLSLCAIVALNVVVTLCVVVVRPGVFDRIIGIGVVGTKTTVLLVLIGLVYGRLEAFVDITLTYALLNFVVTLAVGKYFTREERVS